MKADAGIAEIYTLTGASCCRRHSMSDACVPTARTLSDLESAKTSSRVGEDKDLFHADRSIYPAIYLFIYLAIYTCASLSLSLHKAACSSRRIRAQTCAAPWASICGLCMCSRASTESGECRSPLGGEALRAASTGEIKLAKKARKRKISGSGDHWGLAD